MATAATPRTIGLADRGRTMTLDEFLNAEETEGYRYELARGVLEVAEVPDDPHGVVVCNVIKREEYLAYGLLEYWIVDPLQQQVTVLTRRGDAWDEVVLRDQQVIKSLVLPGLATTVAELWIDVEDAQLADPGTSAL